MVKPYTVKQLIRDSGQGGEQVTLGTARDNNQATVDAARPNPCRRCQGNGIFDVQHPDALGKEPIGTECPLCEGYGSTVIAYVLQPGDYIPA